MWLNTWTVQDRYLILRPWWPEFHPLTDNFTSASVWLRLPDLSVLYWTEDMLRTIVKPLGRFIMMDQHTKNIIAVLNEATLLVFDDYTKERCIAAFLLAKKVYWLRKGEISIFIKGSLSKAVCLCAAESLCRRSSNQKTPFSRISHPFRVPNDYSILP